MSATLVPRIGTRIHVTGNSCSGKTTLASQLSKRYGFSLVELDALNWEPGWVGLHDVDPEELERRMREATSGDQWVVAGSYMGFSKRVFWSKVQTVIWLDLPRRILIPRVWKRSWRRWRSKELLWGTNRELFWPQLMLWRSDKSLITWVATQHQSKRKQMQQHMKDPAWSHIDFVRLGSVAEISQFVTVHGLSETSPDEL